MSADKNELRELVAERYGSIAKDVLNSDSTSGCCGGGEAASPITSELYSESEGTSLPGAALIASLGCGNPTALIDLHEGEVVLDLGSGGGIDVLLSAQRVGKSGWVYGLDMTDDMLELARKNQREAGVENVEFLKGNIENIPLPDESVDVIISNCVINLSTDKPTVFREAQRVLRRGGRFAVSDIVIRGELDPEVRSSVEAWLGCVSGALEEHEFRSGLEAAGFCDVEIVPTRVFTADDARQFLDGGTFDEAKVIAADGKVVSAFIRASRR